MLGHYLLIALRTFRRHPLTTAIKLLALSLGLVCFLGAHVVGDYLRQSDRTWPAAERIRVVTQHLTPPGASRELQGMGAAAAPPLANYLRLDIPELEAVARQTTNSVAVRAGASQTTLNAIAVDPDFVRMFALTPVAGAVHALDAPGVALLEESAAAQLFGDADPIGRTLTLGAGVDVTVAGVFAPIPKPTVLEATRLIVPMATGDDVIAAQFRAIRNGPAGGLRFSESESWGLANYITYILLPRDGSLTAADLDRRLADLASRRVPAEAGRARFEALPLADLAAAMANQQLFGANLGLTLVGVLYALGALILVIGCLDFSNLATAQAHARAREFGLRRTLGARRVHVAAQAFFETGLLALVALILVLPLSILLAAPLGAISSIEVTPPSPDRLDFWLSVLGLAGCATLLAGAYPALVLTRIRPAAAMRPAPGAHGGVRTALIVLQFAAAAFLAITVIVMLQQRAALRTNMSVDDPVVTLAYSSSDPVDMETLRTELLRDPSIVSMSYGVQPFSRIAGALGQFSASADPAAARIPAQTRGVSSDYFRTAAIPLLAGREFAIGRDTPYGDPMPAVIDAATAAMLGFTPDEAVGRIIYQAGGSAPSENPSPENALLIVGVVADRPMEYMAGGASNYIYSYAPNFALTPTPVIRIDADRQAQAMAWIDATWTRLNPDVQQRPIFLDELFDLTFRMFNTLNIVVIGLSAVAIAIAAMGLFGVASFAVQRQLRGIGVRKTLGASSTRVLALMLWDFSKPVIAANLIAWPFAFVAARAYLNLFVTHTDLTVWPFVATLAVSLLIAWIAVAAHVLRAAGVKPANVLKYE